MTNKLNLDRAMLDEMFKRVADKHIPLGVDSIHGNELVAFAEQIVLECIHVCKQSALYAAMFKDTGSETERKLIQAAKVKSEALAQQIENHFKPRPTSTNNTFDGTVNNES